MSDKNEDELEIPSEEEIDNRIIECNSPYCSNEQKFKDFDNHHYLCDTCSSMKVVHSIYAHKFGIIIPEETDVIYKHQTAGVCCNQIYIEGCFIPFRPPVDSVKEDGEWEKTNFISLLSRMNYVGNEDSEFEYSREEVWNKIEQKVPFKFERATAPENMPRSQEALRWVKVIEADEEDYEQMENLEGEIVALTYANSD